ncbi:MAG: hypothetical protein HRU75_01240 [Planctomycetia bacterium]|nr:MAG: hypothetical protein HRU75_01240 [Planctomycetia bacterium]
MSESTTPLVTDEELQAAQAEAVGSGLPDLGEGDTSAAEDDSADRPLKTTGPAAVPIVVPQQQDALRGDAVRPDAAPRKFSVRSGTPAAGAAAAGGSASAATPPAAGDEAAGKAAESDAATTDSASGSGGSVAAALVAHGRLYVAADAALAAIHRPFGWVSASARKWIGISAIITIALSLLALLILPAWFTPLSTAEQIKARRAAAEAAGGSTTVAAPSAE